MNENSPILVVEDNDEDFEMLTIAFAKAQIKNPVYRTTDGLGALDYLFKKGSYSEYESSPRPGLILLDLNLSGYDGRYVLTKIKCDEKLKNIPVIVLTTSSNPKDVDHCYKTGVAGYMLKPVDLNKFEKMIQLFKEYWMDHMIIPEDMK